MPGGRICYFIGIQFELSLFFPVHMRFCPGRFSLDLFSFVCGLVKMNFPIFTSSIVLGCSCCCSCISLDFRDFIDCLRLCYLSEHVQLSMERNSSKYGESHGKRTRMPKRHQVYNHILFELLFHFIWFDSIAILSLYFLPELYLFNPDVGFSLPHTADMHKRAQ